MDEEKLRAKERIKNPSDRIDMLEGIHDEFYDVMVVQNKNFTKAVELVELYTLSTDVSILKTVLVITKGMKDRPDIGPARKKLLERYEQLHSRQDIGKAE